MKAWLLVYDLWDEPYDFMICLDETDALETFMALVEEEMFEEFYSICQDRFEDVDQDWEERAQWVNLFHSRWCAMEVPVIYGNTCC